MTIKNLKRDEEFCPSRLQQAYVAIVCENDMQHNVLEELRSFSFVTEAAKTSGICDIFVKIETEDVEELQDAIDFKIRQISGIKSITILICIKLNSKPTSVSGQLNVLPPKRHTKR